MRCNLLQWHLLRGPARRICRPTTLSVLMCVLRLVSPPGLDCPEEALHTTVPTGKFFVVITQHTFTPGPTRGCASQIPQENSAVVYRPWRPYHRPLEQLLSDGRTGDRAVELAGDSFSTERLPSCPQYLVPLRGSAAWMYSSAACVCTRPLPMVGWGFTLGLGFLTLRSTRSHLGRHSSATHCTHHTHSTASTCQFFMIKLMLFHLVEDRATSGSVC